MSEVWLPETLDSIAANDQERKWQRMASRNWSMLKLCGFIVVMACLLEVRPDQRVQFRFGPEWALPESCGSKILFNFECAGCGLTRGFIWLARGQAWTAWKLNRMSWFFAGAVLAQFPYRAWALADLQDRKRRQLPLPTRQWPKWFGWALIAGLIGSWGLKLAGI